MDFQSKQLTIISVISGILLLFHGIIENISNSIDNEIMLLISKKNIESLDFMLLNRMENSNQELLVTLSAKQLILDQLNVDISKLVEKNSKIDTCLKCLILSLVFLNISIYFPIAFGNKLKINKKMYNIYLLILLISLFVSVVSIIFGFFV